MEKTAVHRTQQRSVQPKDLGYELTQLIPVHDILACDMERPGPSEPKDPPDSLSALVGPEGIFPDIRHQRRGLAFSETLQEPGDGIGSAFRQVPSIHEDGPDDHGLRAQPGDEGFAFHFDPAILIDWVCGASLFIGRGLPVEDCIGRHIDQPDVSYGPGLRYAASR